MSGPTNATNLGALKLKLMAVARMRVGYTSGSHVEHHVYPSVSHRKLRIVTSHLRRHHGPRFIEVSLGHAMLKLFSIETGEDDEARPQMKPVRPPPVDAGEALVRQIQDANITPNSGAWEAPSEPPVR